MGCRVSLKGPHPDYDKAKCIFMLTIQKDVKGGHRETSITLWISSTSGTEAMMLFGPDFQMTMSLPMWITLFHTCRDLFLFLSFRIVIPRSVVVSWNVIQLQHLIVLLPKLDEPAQHDRQADCASHLDCNLAKWLLHLPLVEWSHSH